jgi:serine phosphatase RsbU (regulator of sigma subunit)
MLGIILCFVLFPIGLINLGLEQVLKLKEANIKEDLLAKFANSQNLVEQFNDNEHFAHFLLLNINQNLLRAKNPQKTFKILKNRLQKKYPDSFTFIFWDKNGNQVKALSDEKSYGYIIRKTYQVLKKASGALGNWDEEYENLNLASLSEIDKELKLLRNFLGKLLVSYQLRFPWLSGRMGKPLQTAPPGPRSRIWYRINPKFGFLCFISNDFIKSKAGATYAINRLKKQYPEISVHVSDYPASNDFFPPVNPQNAPKLIQALSRFENLSFEKMEKVDDLLINCQIISQTSRSVCFVPSTLQFSRTKERLRYLGNTTRILIPFLFAFFVWFKTRQNGFLSIRVKLIAIFLYAGGIPLLIMSSIGLEYIEQKRQAMIYDEQSRGINVLYSLDEHFKIYLDDQAKFLRNLIKKKNELHGIKIIEPDYLSELRQQIIESSRPESIQIYNENGRNLVKDTDRTIFSDYTLVSNIAVEMLKTVNNKSQAAKSPASGFVEKINSAMASKRKSIEYLGIGAHEMYHFFEMLGKPQEYKNVAILQLFWRIENLQETFFESFYKKKLSDHHREGINICAYFPVEDRVFTEFTETDRLKSLGQEAFLNQIVRKHVFTLNSKNYSAVALRGLNLDRISLMFLFPLAKIEQSISGLQYQMLFASGIFFLLSILMFNFLARQFLGPVSEIEQAIESIDQRDFSYRLNIDASREFSELSQTFNTTLETLKDIETARIVQENLLPEKTFRQGKLSLNAFSQPFSRVGGDYYDFFTAKDGSLLVFIGDVSGHGISAALIMAMAKATLIYEKNNFSSFENLLNNLDQMIFLNRKSGTREYMTGLLICFDCNSGNLKMINRGHCMPALISSDGQKVTHIRCGGLPLGYNAPQKNQIVTMCLLPGESICLYTDGITEAQSPQGNLLGYEGFLSLLESSWQNDSAKFLEEIILQHSKWSQQAQDDQTIILLRHEK